MAIFACNDWIGAFLFLMNNPFDPFRSLRWFDPLAILFYLLQTPQFSQLTCY